MRAMEVADWAALSDQELLEWRISKLGLRLDQEWYRDCAVLEKLVHRLIEAGAPGRPGNG